MRQGLRALLEQESDLEVIDEAENGHEAVALAREHKPDVVVMDVGMPILNGIEATRQIIHDLPDVRVIALSRHADRHYIKSMLHAGASAYLLKKDAFPDLVQAITAVRDGHHYLSPKIAGVVIGDYLQNESTAPDTPLTAKEREVLQLLAEGMSSQQIADHLNITVSTVGTHRHHILEKLNLQSLPELTRYALREGLIFWDD
jgi:DNA-binding NarL/FixJ family response regulator